MPVGLESSAWNLAIGGGTSRPVSWAARGRESSCHRSPVTVPPARARRSQAWWSSKDRTLVDCAWML